MKKFKAFIALFAVAVLTMSCKKEKVGQPGTNGNQSANNASLSTVAEQTIISDWFSLELYPISDRTEFYLQGTEYFDRAVTYDKAHHVELAYVMMPGARVPVYSRLPMK